MGLLIVAGILVTGCTQPATPATTTPAVTTAPAMDGLANPASVNCGKVGGNVDIKKDAQGNEYGMCTFTNGTTCDEWVLFRNEGCKPFVAPNATPAK
jgi:putative hemolysin